MKKLFNKDVGAKESKLKTNTLPKVIKIILWSFLGLIFVRGCGTFLKPDPVAAIKKENASAIAEFSKTSILENEAFSFSENFARDYFTHEAKDDKALKDKISKYVIPGMLDNIKVGGKITATYTKAYKSEMISQSQIDVYVYAELEYVVLKQVQPNPQQIQFDTIYNHVNIKIPLAFNSNKFVVEDLPVFVEDNEKQNVSVKSYNGTSASAADETAIDGALTQFFKAYYELPQEQINYFLASKDLESKIIGLNKRYLLNKIQSIKSFNDVTKDKFLALVTLEIKDINGDTVTQNFNVKIVKKDYKYYISKLSTRIININN